MQHNEVALNGLGATTQLVHHVKQRLWAAALPEGAPIEDQLRMRMAVMAVWIGNELDSDLGGTVEERAAAAQSVAADPVP